MTKPICDMLYFVVFVCDARFGIQTSPDHGIRGPRVTFSIPRRFAFQPSNLLVMHFDLEIVRPLDAPVFHRP
jgi:hypothetical protein